LVTAIDVLPATLPATALVESASNDYKTPLQVAEVADDDQEWKICCIIDDKDVDSKLHYLVQWTPTWVPVSQTKNTLVLVAEYKKRKQKDEKGLGRLRASKSGKQIAAGVRAIGQTQEKKRRGRPCKQA
jgi:hypothetical protein